MKVQSLQSQAVAEAIERSSEGASQQSATPQPPRPAFYALSMAADAALGSGVLHIRRRLCRAGNVCGERRAGATGAAAVIPATGRARSGSLMLQAGLSINGAGASQTSTFFVMTGAFISLCRRHAVLYRRV
mgnify:CR=1 FL=1